MRHSPRYLSQMADQNVEALKEVYERWGAGDFWTPEIFHPDVELVWARDMPDFAETFHGVGSVGETMRDFLAAWDDMVWTADRFLPFEDGVVVMFTARGRGKGSSVEVEANWAHVWTFREGKAVRIEGFQDQDAARRAAGLS
jgi:ketosteroid isomerase-like protein